MGLAEKDGCSFYFSGTCSTSIFFLVRQGQNPMCECVRDW